MDSLIYYFETALALVVMFSVLVAAHEYGHYLFARLFNMGVEEFAIGFGKKPIFEWMHRTYYVPLKDGEIPNLESSGGKQMDLEGSGSRPAGDIVVMDMPTGKVLKETTRFTVRPLPIGGFVRIKGMVPEEDGSETKIAGGFYNKPPIQRLVVLFAGPLFSVLAGILILVPLFMICGIEKPDNQPIIGEVQKDGPAYFAGLKEKDQVLSIDGKQIRTFFDINSIVRDSADKKLTFDVLRDGKPVTVVVTPALDEKPSNLLDKNLDPTKVVRRQAKLKTKFRTKHVSVGFGEALSMAVSAPIDAVSGLVDMVRQPSTIKDSVGGTIAITTVTYSTVQMGLAAVIKLAALLSISVGIFNLLPVVPLDGGQMALALAELLRGGKRLSMQVQNLASACGLAFMGVLIICVFFLDISRMVDRGNPPKDAAPKKANK